MGSFQLPSCAELVLFMRIKRANCLPSAMSSKKRKAIARLAIFFLAIELIYYYKDGGMGSNGIVFQVILAIFSC